MNTCALKQNLGIIVIQYILALIKCENLHKKLELTYLSKNNVKILKINKAINKLFVKIMHYQWLIEVMQTKKIKALNY